MSLTYDFPKDCQTVFELLTNSDFLTERSLAIGETKATCDITKEGSKTIVSMHREVTRNLPSFAAKLFSAVQVLKMKEVWEPEGEGFRGEYKIEIEGQPVAISATFSLQPSGSGSTYKIQHGSKAKIPLIGKKIEKFIASQTADGCTTEINYALSKLG